MSIKGALKKLEGVITRNSNIKILTFVVPFCKDRDQANKIKQQAIKKACLEHFQERQYIFVINYAMPLASESLFCKQ